MRPPLWIVPQPIPASAVSPSGVSSFTAQVGGGRPDFTSFYASNLLVPLQMRDAYQFPGIPNKGEGQIIAVIDAYGSVNITQDLQSFCSTVGIPQADGVESPLFQVVGPNGNVDPTTWGFETCLDVEWAHAISPQAKILLVVSPDDETNNLLAAVDTAVNVYGADQVSMSFGTQEYSGDTGTGSQSLDTHFDGANTTQTTFFASAGDSDAGEVSYPAVSPYVTGVGGTNVSLLGGMASNNNTVTSETVWNNTAGTGPGSAKAQGTGGNVSLYTPIPAYQSGNSPYGIAVSAVCGSFRGVPDVAYNADPDNSPVVVVDSSYDPPYTIFGAGGTSSGAPQWAGFMARVNSGRVTAGKLPFGSTNQLNTALYAIATGSINDNFLDTVLGNNGNSALLGYDLCTGLGTPKALTLYQTLVALP